MPEGSRKLETDANHVHELNCAKDAAQDDHQLTRLLSRHSTSTTASVDVTSFTAHEDIHFLRRPPAPRRRPPRPRYASTTRRPPLTMTYPSDHAHQCPTSQSTRCHRRRITSDGDHNCTAQREHACCRTTFTNNNRLGNFYLRHHVPGQQSLTLNTSSLPLYSNNKFT